ncbi:MAG: hypothetical protein ACJ786_35630 [Catenulispora sp.]
MTLRNFLPAGATMAFAAGAVVTGAVPAHAGSVANGRIQLTISHHGPILTDDNGLGYDIIVTNNGPDTATNVVVRTTGWECEGGDWSLSSCRRLPDRDDPAKLEGSHTYLDPIAPGGHAEFPVFSLIPDESSGTIRTTTEVISSDQYDTASVPGTCRDGWAPQPDCMSDAVWLSS